MDPATILVMVLVGGGGVTAVGGGALLMRLVGRKKREAMLSLFREVAQRTGLAYSPPDLFGNGAGLIGRLEGFSITVEVAAEDGKIVADIHGGLPEELFVLGRSADDEQYIPTQDRISVGDPALAFAIVGGDEAVALACLGHSVRRALEPLLREKEIRIDHGHLFRRIAIGDAPQVEAMLLGAVSLARRIKEARPPDGLAANVAEDPVPDVRERNLEILLLRFADTPATARALRAALQDADVRIRLAAELWSESSRAAALSSRTAEQLAESFLALDRRLQEPLVPRIAKSGAAAEDLLLLIARHHAQDTSRFPMLFGTSANTLARAALEGLGAVGTVRSVEPLLAMSRGGLLGDPAVSSKAAEAIARIQSRLTGAEAGQLAISEPPPEGALSVPDAAGALSDADARRRT